MIKKRKRNEVMRSLCDIYYKDFREKINLSDVCRKTEIPFDEVVQICVNLEANNFLKCLFQKENKDYKVIDGLQTVAFKKPSPPAFVSLTEDGVKYFEVKSDRKWEFIRTSILTPIVVTILTTLLLNFLSEYLLYWIEQLRLYLGF